MKKITDEEIELIIKTKYDEVDCSLMSTGCFFETEGGKFIRDEIAKRNRWIPVSERLPEKEGIYLTTIFLEHIKEKKYQLRLAIYTNSKFAGYPEVVAWRELPEPFKD